MKHLLIIFLATIVMSACSQKESTSNSLGKKTEYIPTPASVPEEKVSDTLITISVYAESSATTLKKARVAVRIEVEGDSIASAKYRKDIITGALKRAGLPALNAERMNRVANTNLYCTPLKNLSQWLDMTDAQRAEYVATLNAPTMTESDFDAMLETMSDIEEIKGCNGRYITIAADKDTPFCLIQELFEKLREHGLNKFSLLTALKSNDD